MARLSDKKYWNSLYRQEKNKVKFFDKKRWPYRFRYNDYILWEAILKKHLPYKKEAKVLEIGSAPGNFLVNINREFGYTPFGVEYTPKGVEINRELFQKYNLDPNNVIHEDFFSDNFQKKYEKHFDIVISRGFIEHFSDTSSVIEKHIALLAEGGYLLITIPNLTGINKLLANFFNKEGLLTHNTKIMTRTNFSKLFAKKYLKSIFCDYYGSFDFHLFNTKKSFFLNLLLFFCKLLQTPLDFFLIILLRKKSLKNQYLSPYLLFIGKKNDQSTS